MAKEIPLRGASGKVVIVDDEDFVWLSQFKWYWAGRGYAAARCQLIGPANRNTYMHRLIMCAKRGQIIDHIDGDILNNTRANLRFCTAAENNRNARHKTGRSRYRGVQRKKNRFTARITVEGICIYLGCFKSPVEAARAYNEAARKYHGEFAMLNKIEE